MENENLPNNIIRAVWEVKLLLESGIDAIVPLSLLDKIYEDLQNDPSNWIKFRVSSVTIPHKGKRLLYILLKPIASKPEELSVGE